MGLRELSMQPRSLLEVKEIVRGADVERLEKEVEGLFQRLGTEDPGLLLVGINRLH
jgi:phosphoenolpyruvate-protein kinase (PTS system EI component)